MEKAWTINTKNFYEPWFAPTDAFYGNTRNEARKEALIEVCLNGLVDKDGNDFTILTLNMRRAKHLDKILVGEVYKTGEELKYEKRKTDYNNNLDKILAANKNGYAYILKAGFYYRPGNAGYTEHQWEAGVYSIKEAVSEAKGCSIDDYMQVIVIDVDKHNKMLIDKITDLKSRLIPKYKSIAGFTYTDTPKI